MSACVGGRRLVAVRTVVTFVVALCGFVAWASCCACLVFARVWCWCVRRAGKFVGKFVGEFVGGVVGLGCLSGKFVFVGLGCL